MIKRSFICALVLLGACSFSPRETGNAFMFTLSPAKTAQGLGGEGTLVVAMPVAAPELDTSRVALKREDGHWDYYAGVRWSEFLPSVVQDNLTKTLEEANIFKRVTSDEAGLFGDRLLKVEIRDFQAEYPKGSKTPFVSVRMVMSLVTRLERKPLGSFAVTAEKRASGPSLGQIHAAFAAAFTDAEKQIAGRLSQK